MGEMNCELCGMRASMYCESDRARLCWECDARVHGANFLVEKHTRVLLCQACNEATSWKATGPRLGISSSLCHACCSSSSMSSDLPRVSCQLPGKSSRQGDNASPDSCDEDEESYSEDFDSDETGDGNTCETEEASEEEDNQVVPWTPEDIQSSMPSRRSSSSSDDRGNNPDLDSEEKTSSFQSSVAVTPLCDPTNLPIHNASRKRSRSTFIGAS